MVIQTLRGIRRLSADTEDVRQRKALWKHATTHETHHKVTAVLNLSKHKMIMPLDAFDVDHLILNVANGIIDLTTGKLRDRTPKDMVTKIVRVVFDENARSPMWEDDLLPLIFPDVEVRAYVKRVSGLFLTGLTKDDLWFILFGGGGEWKNNLRARYAVHPRSIHGGTDAEVFGATISSGPPRTFGHVERGALGRCA